jgi:hypothetical protein
MNREEPMKLKGEFVLREVAGEIIVIPVGKTALNFNGMICINGVSAEIWKGLQEEKTKGEILENILQEFDVSREEATADLDVFLHQLRENNLLEDEM